MPAQDNGQHQRSGGNGVAIWPILAAGGPVMVPLLVGSIATITVAIERWVFWRQLRRDRLALMPPILDLYARDPRSTLARLQPYADRLPIARICLAALELDRPHPIAFRLALQAATQAELPHLRRFDTLLQSVTGLAPLLGLLGTVTGLMRAFAGLDWDSWSQGTKTSSINLGLSEALVSTATGLIVALIALAIANSLRACYRQERAAITHDCRTLERLYLHCHWHFDRPSRPQRARRPRSPIAS